jgi:hypothetical protein
MASLGSLSMILPNTFRESRKSTPRVTFSHWLVTQIKQVPLLASTPMWMPLHFYKPSCTNAYSGDLLLGQNFESSPFYFRKSTYDLQSKQLYGPVYSLTSRYPVQATSVGGCLSMWGLSNVKLRSYVILLALVPTLILAVALSAVSIAVLYRLTPRIFP